MLHSNLIWHHDQRDQSVQSSIQTSINTNFVFPQNRYSPEGRSWWSSRRGEYICFRGEYSPLRTPPPPTGWLDKPLSELQGSCSIRKLIFTVRRSDGRTYCFRRRLLSVRTITREPLHLAWWNFTGTCTLTTARNPDNFNVTGPDFRILRHCEIGQKFVYTIKANFR